MNRKIVIIGAGASGIAAATKLIENGFKNVLILEGENRIGGRIHTIPFASNVVDMGAQWCHGEKNNVVYEMGKKYDSFASTSAKYDRCLFIQSTGKIIEQDIGDRLMIIAITIMETYKDEMKNYKGSLGNFITEKFTGSLKSKENQDINGNLAIEFFEFFHKYECSIEAADTLFEASCTGYCDYWDCDGDRLLNWKDKGYRSVFDLLMKKLPNGKCQISLDDKIQFKKTVSKINWLANNANNAGDSTITVECADGSKYDADHVICTVSLGVLKECHMKWFRPELPTIKRNAIDGLTLGSVDKLYLEFNEPFWPSDWRGFSLLWTKEDLDEMRKNKNGMPDDNEQWITDIFGFYTVDCQPNIICGWICGVNARHMERLPKEMVLIAIMKLLRRFLKEWHVPDPKSFERSTWYSNPHFRGSYTFKSIKTDLLNTCPADLAMPLTNTLGTPILQFAGEATHNHYYSTVHGAIESGWREANRIMEYYKNEKNIFGMSHSRAADSKDIKEHLRNCPTIELNGNNDDDDDEYYANVLILGSGLAGLGAALQFEKHSIDYRILEAQNRIGGRINTVNLLDYHFSDSTTESDRSNFDENFNRICDGNCILVDAGAQWLHGKYNELYKIAEMNGLLIDAQSEEGMGQYRRDDGIEFDQYFVKKINYAIGQILEECEEFAQTNDQMMIITPENNCQTYPKSIENHMRDNFQCAVLNHLETDAERIMAIQLLDWHIRFHIIDNSCLTLTHVSAKNWGKYSFNGESCQAHYNFRNGFSSIVDALLLKQNQYIEKNRISMNKEVTAIEAIDANPEIINNFYKKFNRHRNRNDNGDNLILVRCSDGTVYYCNHVIVTFSIGVLKANMHQLFNPPLPLHFQQTINEIGFQTINKIFLQFDRPWWGGGGTTNNGTTTAAENDQGIQLVFEHNDYENQNWTRHLTGFDLLKTAEPLRSNTLLAWVGGPGALQMESLTDDQIINDLLKILKQFTKLNVPAPIKYYCTRWNSNKFFMGSYSYISIDSDTNETCNDDLTKPITFMEWKTNNYFKNVHIQSSAIAEQQLVDEQQFNRNNSSDKREIINNHNNNNEDDANNNNNNNNNNSNYQNNKNNRPILLFAGEACHQQYFSTAHGAFLSGIQQAQTLINYFS